MHGFLNSQTLRKFVRPALCLAILGMALTTSADTPAPLANLPVITLTAGLPVLFTWADGRVATLSISRKAAGTMPLQLKVADNTCNYKIGTICQFNRTMRMDYFALVWTTHPDPTKIGTVVQKSIGPGSSPQTTTRNITQIMGTTDGHFQPKIGATIPEDELTCPEYSWIPGGTETQAPDALNITRWHVEGTGNNFETDLNETRTLQSVFDVALKRTNTNSLKISFNGEFSGPQADVISLNPFNGLVVAWMIPNSDGQMCQIGLNTKTPDTTGFNSSPQAIYQSTPSTEPYVPYVWGSDEYTPLTQIDASGFASDPMTTYLSTFTNNAGATFQ